MTISVPFAWIEALVDDNWGTPGSPDNAFSATAKIALSVAATGAPLDPPALSRYTGMPAPFIAATLRKCNQHSAWPDGVHGLSQLLINHFPDKQEIDSALRSLLEEVWMELGTHAMGLEQLWFQLTGQTDDVAAGI